MTQSKESITRITSYRPLSFSTFSWQLTADSFYLLTDCLTTGIDPSNSSRMTLNIPLIMTPFPPIVILSGGKNALWEKREMEWWHGVKNLLHRWCLTVFLTTIADPSPPFRMTINVLYKDHGVGRQKELLAHAVRLRMLACRNDLNRKRIVSLQLTAHSW